VGFALAAPVQESGLALMRSSNRTFPTMATLRIAFPEVGGLHHRYERRAAEDRRGGALRTKLNFEQGQGGPSP
jgi:hypothetical protein